jgi:hypothetical protein
MLGNMCARLLGHADNETAVTLAVRVAEYNEIGV